MVDAPTFRSIFPEFANTTTYPDASINFWIGLGTTRLDTDIWGDQLDYGMSLFVAHNLAIGQRNVAAANRGLPPGEIAGATQSKSVENVSVSYDTSFVKLDNLGYWGLTSYGLQFLQLAQLIGSFGYFL